MLKKIFFISLICLSLSVAVFTISLPFTMKGAIGRYNQLVADGKDFVEETVIGESVNEVKLFVNGNTGSYNNLVLVGQSPDDKVRIQTNDNGFWHYEVLPIIEGDKATLRISRINTPSITEENMQKLIFSQNMHSNIYLELPPSVSITSQSGDGLHFQVPSVVNFPNAEQIRSHGYSPTEEESWQLQYQQVQDELMNSQNELAHLENELSILRSETYRQDDFSNSTETEEVYHEFTSTDSFFVEYQTNRSEIEKYLQEYAAEKITHKQYIEMTEDLYTEILDIKQRELQTKNTSYNAELSDLVASVCNKLQVLDDCRIEKTTNLQLLNRQLLSETAYKDLSKQLEEKETDVQLSIERDKRTMNQLGYDWDKGIVETSSIPQTVLVEDVN